MIRVRSCPDFGEMRFQPNGVEDLVGVPVGQARSEPEIETHTVGLDNRRVFNWDLLDPDTLGDGRKTSISERLISSGSDWDAE